MFQLGGLYRKMRLIGVTGLFPMMVALEGCSQQGYSVLALTSTVIGVEISQNPANQMPHAKLGYNRGELAFVPTNRNGGPEAGGIQHGAKDTANVLMELRYGGIFDWGPSSGIYQRLAVGEEAVKQPGASLMFSRDTGGKIDAETRQALENIRKIETSSADVREQLAKIAQARSCHRGEVDAAIQRAGAGSFDQVMDGKGTTAQLEQILSDISTLSPCE